MLGRTKPYIRACAKKLRDGGFLLKRNAGITPRKIDSTPRNADHTPDEGRKIDSTPRNADHTPNEDSPNIITTNIVSSDKSSTPKKGLSKLQRTKRDLPNSKHFPFLEKMVDWFSALDHTVAARGSERWLAMGEAGKVLRIDMRDVDDCEDRLRQIIIFAATDEGDGDFSWKDNLKSLRSLRAKRKGVMKWINIESAMKRQASNSKPPESKPDELIERLPGEDADQAWTRMLREDGR